MILTVLFFLTATLFSCSLPTTSSLDSEIQSTSTIIFVPGYYGTRLVREPDDHIIWISATEALWGNQPLTLPIPGLELANTINLRPDGILDTVQVIPLIYSVDVYGSILDALRSFRSNNIDVIPFTYDWRGDLIEAVHNLDAMIQQLRQEGTHDISLVAHSMGGLIVSYYLRYGTQEVQSATETWEGAENISSIVMAGVPFLGVMNSFRNMNFGITVKFNTAMLTSEAYASFPSSYYTLPVLEIDRLLTPKLTLRNGTIRNPENWENFSWGLLNNKTDLTSEIVNRRAKYMSFWLRRSQKFLELLQAPLQTPSQNHPPLLYLYAAGTPTLNKGVWMENGSQGPDSLFFNNWDPDPSLLSIDPTLLYDNGDETVTVHSASLPPAYHETFHVTVKEYGVKHSELVTDPDIQQEISAFLENR